MAEAKGKDSVAKGEFEYRHKRTGKTRYEVSVAKAKADEVAREKCESKAAETDAKADAKAQLKIGEIADVKPSKARTKA